MDSSLDQAAPAAAGTLPSGDDLSAIAWVQEELRRSLEAAHKSLRRFLKDAEAVTSAGTGCMAALDAEAYLEAL